MGSKAIETIPPAVRGLDNTSSPGTVPEGFAPVLRNLLVHREGLLPMRGPIHDTVSRALGTNEIITGAWVFNDNILVSRMAKSATAKQEPWTTPYRKAAASTDLARASTTMKLVNLTAGSVTDVASASSSADIIGGRGARIGAYVYGFAYDVNTGTNPAVSEQGGNLYRRRFLRWDGSTTAPTVDDGTGGPEGGQDVIAHLNRIWALGGRDNPSLAPGLIEFNSVYYSDLFGPTTMSDDTFWKETTNSNKTIVDSDNPNDFGVGFALQDQNLMVFKRRSIHILYGYSPSTFQWRPLTYELGCVDRRSIVQHAGSVYWMSDQGIHSYDGQEIHSHELHAPIEQDLVSAIAQTVGDSGVDGGRAIGTILPNEYALFAVSKQNTLTGAQAAEPAQFSALLHCPTGRWTTFRTDAMDTTVPVEMDRTSNHVWITDGTSLAKATNITAPDAAVEADRGYDLVGGVTAARTNLITNPQFNITATPTFRSVSNGSWEDDDTPPAPTLPAGFQQDDVAIMYINLDGTDTITSDPVGWTKVVSGILDSTAVLTRFYAYVRVLQSGDSGPTWVNSAAGTDGVWAIAAYSGCNATTPYDPVLTATPAAAPSQAVNATTLGPGRKVVLYCAGRGGGLTSTPPGGTTERLDNTAGTDAIIRTIADIDVASAGGPTAHTFTISGGGVSGTLVSVPLIPAATGTSGWTLSRPTDVKQLDAITPPAAPVAEDNFDSHADGNLTGKTAPVGGVWRGDDLNDHLGQWAKFTYGIEAAECHMYSPEDMSDKVGVCVYLNPAGDDSTESAAEAGLSLSWNGADTTSSESGVYVTARNVDENNFIRCGILYTTSGSGVVTKTFRVDKVVASVTTNLYSTSVGSGTIRCRIEVDGTTWRAYSQGVEITSGTDAVLGTTLATGGYGLTYYWLRSGGKPGYYTGIVDDFVAWDREVPLQKDLTDDGTDDLSANGFTITSGIKLASEGADLTDDISVTSGVVYTASCYVRAKSASCVASLDISNITGTASDKDEQTVSVADGWVRLNVTGTANATATRTVKIENTSAEGAGYLYTSGVLLEVGSTLYGYIEGTVGGGSARQARIPAAWHTRLAHLAHPDKKSQAHRLILDYAMIVDAQSGDEADYAPATADGWFVSVVAGDGSGLLPEFQVPTQGDPGGYLYRRSAVKDFFTEAADMQVRMEYKDDGSGTVPALVKAELYDVHIEYQPTREKRSS